MVNSPFDPAKHPRNIADGQFTETSRTDPGRDVLGGGQTSDPKLDEALDRYGLTADQVPGLAEAWNDNFAILNMPRPDTVEDCARDILGNPNWGRHRGGPRLEVADDSTETGSREFNPKTVTDQDQLLLRVHTRNGGGNREHDHDPDEEQAGCTACATEQLQRHPLYLKDQDDDYDSTYANFWFRVPPENRTEMLQAADFHRTACRWDLANQRRQAMIDGSEAPWKLLASKADTDAHEQAVRDAQSATVNRWDAERHTATIAKAETFLAVADGRQDIAVPNMSIEVADPSNRMWGRRTVDLRGVSDLAVKAADATARQAKFAAIKADIDAGHLSPELRDYLVGERPPQSYRTVEGTGRNKRNVTRTFTPRTDFVQQSEKAAADAAHYPAELAETRRLIQNKLDASRQTLQAGEQAQARLAQLAAQEWALGWPGDPADVPARPATFDDKGDFE